MLKICLESFFNFSKMDKKNVQNRKVKNNLLKNKICDHKNFYALIQKKSFSILLR